MFNLMRSSSSGISEKSETYTNFERRVGETILFNRCSAQFLNLTILPLGDNLPQGCTEHTGNK